MNNLKKIFFLVSFILILTSCTEDEQVNEDCYACETTQTEYCYTIGNSYYLTTNNEGNSFQTELNGASWSDLRADFVTACEGGTINNSIVSTWEMVRYQATNETTSTFDGAVIAVTTINSLGTSFDNYLTVFSENPNEAYSSGQMTIHSIMTLNGNESEYDNIANPDSSQISQWEIDGDQLTFTPLPDFVDSVENTILELTDNSLKLKSIIHTTTVTNGATNVTVGEIYSDYVR